MQRGGLPVDLSRPWDRIRAREAAEVAHPRSPSLARERARDGRRSAARDRADPGAQGARDHRAHLADDPVRKAVEAAGDRIAAAFSEVVEPPAP